VRALPVGADLLTPIVLAFGAVLPRLGLGTWPLDDQQAEAAVFMAISLGYRMIDTAYDYGNEVGVGRGIRRALAATGLSREDIVVTTKFNAQWHGVQQAQDACQAALERLGLGYVDLFLIHWPNPWLDRYVDAWRGLIKLRQDGRVRAVGGSNFLPRHLERIHDETGVHMEVNQIQISPYSSRADQREYHRRHGIATQSWSPLARGRELLAEPVLRTIAGQTVHTPAQVVLRWHLQLNLSVVPKSSDPGHQRQNASLFDFELTPDQMAAISSLERGTQGQRDPETYGH
jgi:2,5-diketo-D-gluconate reductase A